MPKKKKFRPSEAFGEGEDWHLNAIISHDHFSSSDLAYIWGFESAVGALTAVSKSVANGDGQPYPGTDVLIDTIVYPQVFCARHFIELSLKYMLKQVALIGGNAARVKIVPTHNLVELLDGLITYIRDYAPSVLSYVEPLTSMVKEISDVDEDGDAFRYARTRGDKHHLPSLERINIERFQEWFDRLRKLVANVFLALDYELDELDKGGRTRRFKRAELIDLAERLPKVDAWKNATLRPIFEKEKCKRQDLSYKQFEEALNRIKVTPWLALTVGSEIPLPEVSSDLFSRVLGLVESTMVEPVEWGALYCIFRVGGGGVPEEYGRMMSAAKKTAIEFEMWDAEVAERHSAMTDEEIEAESELDWSTPGHTFDTAGMAIYHCEGKIRALLLEGGYIFCRGLKSLGQPTLLDNFQEACNKAGLVWTEPEPSASPRAKWLSGSHGVDGGVDKSG